MQITRFGTSSATVLSVNNARFLFTGGEPIAAIIGDKWYSTPSVSSTQTRHKNEFFPYDDDDGTPHREMVCASWFDLALRSVLFQQPIPSPTVTA